MGLLQRIFGTGERERDAAGPPSSQFHESETTSNDTESRSAPRRELVQVILRDTMRKHGIPSDWIECRILSAVSRSGRSGLHVNFVVKQAHDRLLAYVFAFQDSFERELARFEPRARDWLISVGWEFQGQNLAASMPDPNSWTAASGHTALAANGSTAPLHGSKSNGELKPLELPKGDDDVQRDLEALFAIRDAAIAQGATKGKGAGEEDERDPDRPDFEPTQPFEDSGTPQRR